MDIYEYAKKMEKDGENYYRELAQNCKTPGLQKIFTMLADEEVKHFNFIVQLQQNTGQENIEDSGILQNVKNVFEDMKETHQELFINTTADANAYRKALDIEEQSKVFYKDKAEEAEDQDARMLFLRLAKEEEKHERIVETIIEFVTRPEPGNWLEDAEWHHLEEY